MAQAKRATVVVDVDGTKLNLPLHGPFGDKTQGSELVTDYAQSDPKKRKGDDAEMEYTDVLRHTDGVDYWAVQCYVPASDAEMVKLCNAKPANVRLAMRKQLMMEARQMSWREVRGNGSVNVWASLNGASPSWLPKPAVEALLAAGHKVTIMESPRKSKASK